jgi:argininosuccinate lyase
MTEKLWGGRFAIDLTPDVVDYTNTVDIDQRLVEADIWQDIAHALMLGHQRIISDDATRGILSSLLSLSARAERGEFALRADLEDVHLNIETAVIDEIGPEPGGRLHTARSRNDQVATDTRIYLRTVLLEAVATNAQLVDGLIELTDEDYLSILPGYTHSQPAQPITVAFWKTAHASALLRDIRRLRHAYEQTDECPLGGCALAGTSFPINRDLTARLLGFRSVLTHALDGTGARDYIIEVAAALAIGGNNLSRMAEEIVTWSGHEYRLCTVGDQFATGSSIMPQKKNPVVAELVRARSGRLAGALVQLLTAVKGVALGYSCDLQEDKPVLWLGIDAYLATLRVVCAQASTIHFDASRGAELCWDNFSTATELANHLVTECGLPFRQAHRVTGELVGALLRRGLTFRQLAAVVGLLRDMGHVIAPETLESILAPRAAVLRCTSKGGTAPLSVRLTRDELSAALTEHRAWAEACLRHLAVARDASVEAARGVVEGIGVQAAVKTALGRILSDGYQSSEES